jgi:hypothetical protein
MNLSRTAFGTWNGGRFMNFGAQLDEAHFSSLIQRAYEKGIRTFMTADVYGSGAADEALGRAALQLPALKLLPGRNDWARLLLRPARRAERLSTFYRSSNSRRQRLFRVRPNGCGEIARALQDRSL